MSFHTNYKKWLRKTDPANCPVCNQVPMPDGMIDLAELPSSWLNTEPVDCLKGASHLTAKYHGIELFDLAPQELHSLMDDVAVCAKAIQRVTGAVKINYEIHGNSTPHLHVHLYPRYLDDPFPGRPIDYNRKTADIYGAGEYDLFVAELKLQLKAMLGEKVSV